MSNFSDAHTVTPFDAKTSKAFTGQRLAKIRYKSTAQNKAKYPSVCVSVPPIDKGLIEQNITRLAGYFAGYLQDAQDGVIRSLYESSDGMLDTVTNADISIDAIIGYLEAESTGGRLTKEFLEAWYDSSMSETVQALAIEKLKYSGELTPEQDLKIAQVSNGYKGIISSLAGGKTILQPAVIKQIKGILELIDLDETGTKLQAKLIAMENKPSVAEMLELL